MAESPVVPSLPIQVIWMGAGLRTKVSMRLWAVWPVDRRECRPGRRGSGPPVAGGSSRTRCATARRRLETRGHPILGQAIVVADDLHRLAIEVLHGPNQEEADRVLAEIGRDEPQPQTAGSLRRDAASPRRSAGCLRRPTAAASHGGGRSRHGPWPVPSK